jgi:dTDP-glucose 4,6-dehydratase
MRLLVTGGAGFIGSHFIRLWVQRHPADEVVNFDALTYAGSPDRLADVAGARGYRAVTGDIGDARAVAEAVRGCEAVVHLAAETHVDRSITNATPFLRTNIEGTYVLAEAARAAGVRRFLHVSTDEVYGPVLAGAVDERATLAPHSPYAASKAAGDLLVQAHHQTHALPAIIARPTNVYGPWQLPEKFLPVCITSAMEARAIPLYGDGEQRRNWLFVTDLCEALVLLLARGQVGEIYNVGSGHEQGNRQTAEQVVRLLGQPVSLIQHVADRPAHDRRYAMDDAKLRALGWGPSVRFADGLAQTVAWYRGHGAWWRPLTERLREDRYHWLDRTAGTGAR